MIDLHRGKARFIGRIAAIWLIGVAVAALVVAIMRDPESLGEPLPNPPLGLLDPCGEAFQHQQVSLPLQPTDGNESKRLKLDSLIGVGVASNGVCVDTHTEFYEEGWRIATIYLSVSSVTEGPDASEPVQFTREGGLETEALALWAPIEGCVEVQATVQAVSDEPQASKGALYATWTAKATYGQDCADAPGASL